MKKVLIKIGGSTVDAAGLLEELARGLIVLKKNGSFPVIVHGGGKDIARNLKKLNREFEFVEGMRVTDAEMLETVQMVLSGDVNKRIVNALQCEGVDAAGISGVDGSLFEAQKLLVGGKDIGFVGDVVKVNTKILDTLIAADIVPVVSPISRDTQGTIYNVNADPAASEAAIAIQADHLIYISDVAGVLINGSVAHEIRCESIEQLIQDGHITGGMIPKLRSAAEAVARGAGKVHICQWYGDETLFKELDVKTASGTVIY